MAASKKKNSKEQEEQTSLTEQEIYRPINNACFDCPMRAYSKEGEDPPIASGRGMFNPEVVFISEYPGEREMELGTSFSGEAGFLFHSVLAAVDEEVPGASEIAAYEDNAIICRPETVNDFKKAVQVCRKSRLVPLLEKIKPKVIVLMGGTAVESLLDKEKVMPHLWKFQTSPYLHYTIDDKNGESQSPKILVDYNPASVLRNPDQFKTYADIIILAAGIVAGTIKPLPKPNTRIAQNLEDVTEFLDILSITQTHSADLETSDLNPYTGIILSIAFSPNKEATYIIPWDLLTEIQYPVENSQEIRIQLSSETQKSYFDRMRDFLESEEHDFIFHNGSFDESYLRAANIGSLKRERRMRISDDPMLLHYELDERTGLGTSHGLKTLSTQYFAAPDWEATIWQYLKNRNESFEVIPREVLYDYAQYDTPYTYALKDVLHEIATPEQLEHYKNTLLPWREMLVECQERGIYIDIPELLRKRKEIAKDIVELDDLLQSICGLPGFNPGSTQQVQKVLFGDFRLERPTILNNRGEEEVMEGSGEPVLLELLKGAQDFLHSIEELEKNPKIKSLIDLVREAENIDRRYAFILGVLVFRDSKKDLSTYFDGVARFISPFDRCIHPFTHITGTETGRFTGSRPSLLNVKNSNRVKTFYKARPGFLLGYADQAAMELRVFACMNEDHNLRDILVRSDEAEAAGIKGQDIHSQVGKMVFPYYDQAPKWWRAIVKTIVYGVLYGRSANAIAVKHKLALNEAQDYRNRILDLFSTIRPYEDGIVAQIRETNKVVTPFGRSRSYPFIPRDRRAFSHIKNSGINMPVQSVATDINSWSMYDVWSEREEQGTYPLWPIHDAVLYELKANGSTEEEQFSDASRRMDWVEEVMVSTAPRRLGSQYEFCPFRVDPKVASNWSQMSDEESFFAQVLALIGQE